MLALIHMNIWCGWNCGVPPLPSLVYSVRFICCLYNEKLPVAERILKVTRIFAFICYGLLTDLAVGSPYEKSGAVYIYLGSDKGIRMKASQVIYGSDVGNHLSTFGYSLSAGIDLDKNGYTGKTFP